MKKLLIKGGSKLKGEIDISGAKNAALPIICASLLTEEDLLLSNMPHLTDISTILNILVTMGVKFEMNYNAREIRLNAKNINNLVASYDLVKKMRASILILGPILSRFKKAKISLPGGCAIGTRPVNLHIEALEKMGAEIKIDHGYINAVAENGLYGAEINFDIISVGATENILMAASLAKGETIINNAAREPEVTDLANCLIKMGADIRGHGTSQIIINGVERLHKASHNIISDRIEAGTYIIAAAMTKGELILNNIDIKLLFGFIDKLRLAGIYIEQIGPNKIIARRQGEEINPVNIETNPYPGFPTDMQAQFMSLMTIANGKSIITENIFENRFMHVLELVRLGANIKYNGTKSEITGVKELTGGEVMATDLRASVSLALAGLISKGDTVINRLYHLERGYERLSEKLNICGADTRII